MLEPTDEDIAEALRLAGFPDSPATLKDFKTPCTDDEEPTHVSKSIASHARTIAKLRIAVEALEEMTATAAVVAGSFALRGEYGWGKADQAELDKAEEILHQIKGQSNEQAD